MSETVALIPARGGSARVPGKNIRHLDDVPLIAYTISLAKQSGEFSRVLVSSDDTRILEIANSYGADVLRRPEEFAIGSSPDIRWVTHALDVLKQAECSVVYSILRPTSPFRTTDTIRRAFKLWNNARRRGYTSLRAVEPVSQHPGKMWRLHGDELVSLLPQPARQPWHDSQYTELPTVYVQNASLEISHTQTLEDTGTISGHRVLPFLTRGYEGFDINTELDWAMAELLLQRGDVKLPDVIRSPDPVANEYRSVSRNGSS